MTSTPKKPTVSARKTQKPPARAQAPATGGARKPAPGKGRAKAAPQAKRQVEQPGTNLHGAEAVAALVVSAQQQARTKTKIILVLMAVLCLSLVWNSIQSATRPEPKLLAVTNDGRVQPLPLLDEPIDNRATIVDWARRNLPKLYDFNYANYQSALNQNLDFMGQRTNDSFINILNNSGILPKVLDEFLIM